MRTLLFAIVFVTSACGARPQFSTATRNSALERYSQGESIDDIARELGLGDRETARAAVQAGMMAVAKRYYNDR